jgi:signal peptidase I
MSAVPRAVSTSAAAALVLTAVWLFWPSAMGGSTTYVTTHGTSMQPDFHTGDLAVLSPAQSYGVGDVVAYPSSSLHTIVMHRIVSGDADGFVTQGDNNDWVDRDRPAEDEILGSLLLRIPQGGTVLGVLGAPGVLPFAGAAVVAFFGLVRQPRSGSRGRSARRRRSPLPSIQVPARIRSLPMDVRARAARIPTPVRGGTAGIPMAIRARARQIELAGGAGALLAVVGLAVLAALPATQTDTRTVRVTQQGQFTYSGSAVPGTTYPSGRISTGDTVWTRLTRGLTVSFTNTVTGPDIGDLRGVLRLDVVVAASDGWSAVLTSGPVVTLHDGTATASVRVDPNVATQLVNRHFAEIGASGGAGTLTVTPVAATTGTVEGRPFTADSPAGLAFSMDAASLRPAGTSDAELAPAPQTAVHVDETVPRRFTVLRLSVPIDEARVGAAVVLGAALAAFALGAWIRRSSPPDVADSFLVRHAERIVPVAGLASATNVIDVSDAESLHRVAERFDTVVLHHAGPDEDVFAVRDLDATYRFVVAGAAGRQRGKPPVPPVRAPAPAADPAPPVVAVPTAVPSSAGLPGRVA